MCNACRELLKNADSFLVPKIYDDLGGPLPLYPIVAVFKTLNKIVHSCFSVMKVDKSLHVQIEEFKKGYLVTQITETLKVHVAVAHIESCHKLLYNKTKNKTGLGVWLEQPGESVHREFLKFWNRRKINQLENPSYPKHLKDAVIEFSSIHIQFHKIKYFYILWFMLLSIFYNKRLIFILIVTIVFLIFIKMFCLVYQYL